MTKLKLTNILKESAATDFKLKRYLSQLQDEGFVFDLDGYSLYDYEWCDHCEHGFEPGTWANEKCHECGGIGVVSRKSGGPPITAKQAEIRKQQKERIQQYRDRLKKST